MKLIIETERLPIKLWLDDIEDGAMAQARNLANLQFAFRHIAIMPDAHLGYGMPIGGVLATKGFVIPNAVGVDIGCGVCAIKTPWTVDQIGTERLKAIMGRIREAVPVGFDHHKETQPEHFMPGLPAYSVVSKEYGSALKQLGTLGGGNHFIEIQADQSDQIWIMIHSGSRNLGYKVAKVYNDIAINLGAEDIPKEWELAALPENSDAGYEYLSEMNYCVRFALSNRRLMMERIVEAFNKEMPEKMTDLKPMINIAHNYAEGELHFGEMVMVHRKGATLAREGGFGIIPGSQGTCSYIVCGKGNPESFMSCSHGAGRKMGRKAAQRTLNLEAEKKQLDDQGIIHAIRTTKDLDEAAGAYKEIDVVMANQSDLVDIFAKLRPLAVIKG